MRRLIKAAPVLLPALARAQACESCPGCAGSGPVSVGPVSVGPVSVGPVAMGPVAALGLLRGPRRWRARLSSLRAAGSGQLRLVGGGGRCAGRVEVKHGGEWGSVCVFDFDWEACWAAVVCRQLGCGRVARASPYAPFGQGSGRIWLQPFFCLGTEDALEECPHFGWGQHFCGHERDVGVTCTDAVELRLAGGSSPCAGRVEVKLQGEWGSVGDDDWDMEDAEVVCQHLGCGSASGAYFARESFGTGDGLYNLALLDCSGLEATLWDCEIRGWGPYNSSDHSWETAVVCQGFSRLVGGDGDCAGHLEVRRGRSWVGVCEDQVDMKAAQVVCRELGCGEALAIPGSARFGRGSGSFWDGGFQCNGTESLLSACARRPSHSQGCAGPASVICSAYSGFRLGNSSSGCSGRVEVAVRGTWGSVCASEWDLADAHVLCRHLGCGRASSVPPGGSFGSGEGPLRPDAFGCRGSERHPGECPVAVLGKPPCVPGNAAAVKCSGSVVSLRLLGGESRCDGFLEVAADTGAWHRVPGEVLLVRNFTKVCRELGCGGLDRTDSVHGNISMLDVNTTERSIIEEVIQTIMDMTTTLTRGRIDDDNFWYEKEFISTAPADIPHGNYIVCSGGCPEKGQRCGCPSQPPQPIPSMPTGSRQVRLAGSSGRCAGRVEVYSGGSWSSVCQEGWELQDAAVVCRELGCGTALEAPSRARFGAGTGPLWPYVPDCSGSEESLWECGRTERRECGPGGGAGAVCSGRCRAPQGQGPAEAPGGSWPCRDPPAPLAEQLSVRLAGGPGRCRGYLEVSYNGTWGRVCADGTSTGTAAAVCRQLGCGHRGWLSAVPTQQPSLAWLAWVGCEDGARSLWGCPSAPWHLQSCGTGGYAHVSCAEDSDGTSEGHTTPYPEAASSTGSSARACIPHRRLAGIPLPSLPACVPTGVPRGTPSAVAVGTVPVPTVLCVVLGTLLCLSLGALALLLCRARARRRGGSQGVGNGDRYGLGVQGLLSCGKALKVARADPGPGRAADAISNAVYEELYYKAMPEYQEVPTPQGSLSKGWENKLPYYTGDSVEGSDTEAAPGPPAGAQWKGGQGWPSQIPARDTGHCHGPF
ncbi:scavenger receptor cysteine-rich type 1 protein M130-like [Lonchura striata]